MTAGGRDKGINGWKIYYLFVSDKTGRINQKQILVYSAFWRTIKNFMLN